MQNVPARNHPPSPLLRLHVVRRGVLPDPFEGFVDSQGLQAPELFVLFFRGPDTGVEGLAWSQSVTGVDRVIRGEP
ncbi:hypothetical protein D9M70_591000 [compost metagenome]